MALLANTLATVGGPYILIEVFGPVSGAHFNPAAAFGRIFSDSFAGIAPASVLDFVPAQLVGAGLGVALHRVLGPRPSSD